MCAIVPLRQQWCTGLAADRTRRSAGRLAGHGLAGGASTAAEFLVAGASTVTPREPKSRVVHISKFLYV